MARAWSWLSVAVSAALLSSGCDDEAPGRTSSTGGVGGSGGEGGGGELCPDPADPRVHYVSEDVNECGTVTLECTEDQNGFQNQCGCGCIDKGDPLCPLSPDDPEIIWISMDPAECGSEPPECGPDETPFNNSCGCGCVQH